MAKSKASFSKKEKEKEKQKRRKEKAEKKEERKANSNKGKNFEEMFAYVDEFGVISSTPQERVKKDIKKEEIQISIPKQEKRNLDERRKGTITFFNSDKGFGFIKDNETQDKVFVHVSGLIDDVKENDVVSYKPEYTHRGMTAVDVRK